MKANRNMNDLYTCDICGNSVERGAFWRCQAHFRCDGCGTSEGLVFRRGGLWCDECHAKRAAAEVAEFKGDTAGTQEITCPWCGNEIGDSWECGDDGKEECENCGHSYSYERNVDVTYYTIKGQKNDEPA